MRPHWPIAVPVQSMFFNFRAGAFQNPTVVVLKPVFGTPFATGDGHEEYIARRATMAHAGEGRPKAGWGFVRPGRGDDDAA